MRALQLARGVVANDTGPGHLAAAAGARLISLYGPRSVAAWTPIGANVRSSGCVEVATVDCVVEATLLMGTRVEVRRSTLTARTRTRRGWAPGYFLDACEWRRNLLCADSVGTDLDQQILTIGTHGCGYKHKGYVGFEKGRGRAGGDDADLVAVQSTRVAVTGDAALDISKLQACVSVRGLHGSKARGR